MAQETIDESLISSSSAWVRPAAALVAIGWGANQFAPMIVLYEQRGVSASATAMMFGLYAVGLIPALIVGGSWSDRSGRRIVVVNALLLSLLASVTLMAGADERALLFLGRCLAGVSSGLAFGTGAAWVRELSAAQTHPHSAARRATIAMTVGFGGGPLVAGVMAQSAPSPQLWPYAPHVALCVVALVLIVRFDGSPVVLSAQTARRHEVPTSVARHLATVSAPFAPWVFGTAAIALAYLPSVVAAHAGSYQLIFAAVATAIPAFAGVLIQPVVKRVSRGRTTFGLLLPAMVTAIIALIIAVWAAAVSTVGAVLIAAVALGAAYGVTQFAGLVDIQHVAPAAQLGAAVSGYQALSYLGFALPYLLTLAHNYFGWSPTLGLSVVVAIAAASTLWLMATDRTRSRPG